MSFSGSARRSRSSSSARKSTDPISRAGDALAGAEFADERQRLANTGRLPLRYCVRSQKVLPEFSVLLSKFGRGQPLVLTTCGATTSSLSAISIGSGVWRATSPP